MRVLQVQECPSWGGGSVQLLALSQGLRRRGHEAHIATEPGGELWRRADACGLPVVGIQTRSELNPVAIGRLVAAITGRGIDLVNAHGAHAHSLGLIAASLTGRPFVLSRRVSFLPKDNLGSRIKYRSRAVSRIIAVSRAVRDVLVRYGVEPDRIDVVYSGTDPLLYDRTDGERVRRELGVASAAPLVGMVANRYHRWKGHDVFVEAAAKVLAKRRDVVFLAVGERTDDERMRGMVEEAGVAGSFVLAGRRTDIPDVLAALDVSVSASRGGEGLSGAVRESLMAGRPVVASDVGGNREIIEDGATGRLVPPDDADAMASAVLDILGDPQGAAGMARSGAELAHREFTVEAMVEKTIRVYERALRPRR